MCGDYSSGLTVDSTQNDTTPRVRGLLEVDAAARLKARYNPACAGTTWFHFMHRANNAIQPRVCGDYALEVFLK